MNNITFDRSQLKPLTSTKVSHVGGKPVQQLDMTANSAPLYMLASLIPIANQFGEYPTLEQSLIERAAGVRLDASMLIGGAVWERSVAQYGALTSIAVPQALVHANPSMQITPLRLELLSYVPFTEGGVQFIMVSLIEYGRRKDVVAGQQGEAMPPMSVRYVYHAGAADAGLRFLPSHEAAVQALLGACASN